MLLLDGLLHALYRTPGVLVPSESAVWEVSRAQRNIGWSQMLKGRFSHKWSEYQDCYLGAKSTKKNNGTTWMIGLIDLIFQEWWKLWELRNSDRHGHDLVTQTQAESRQTLRELTLLYETYQNQVGQTQQWLFAVPLQTRMQMRTNALRQWLNTWKPVLEKSYATALETG